LRAKFAAVCGEPTPSHNKVWLIKRIAWLSQASSRPVHEAPTKL
jgi:hypothetical protein